MKLSGCILILLITGTIFGTLQEPSLSHYQDEEPLSIRAQGMGGILPLPVGSQLTPMLITRVASIRLRDIVTLA